MTPRSHAHREVKKIKSKFRCHAHAHDIVKLHTLESTAHTEVRNENFAGHLEQSGKILIRVNKSILDDQILSLKSWCSLSLKV